MTFPTPALAATVALSLLAAPAKTPPRQDLSEHFVAEPFSGRGEHLDLYVRTAEGGLQYVGSTPGPDRYVERHFGGPLGRSVLAVAKDGRAIAFVHEPSFAKRRSTNVAGIYRYEQGKGAELLYPKAALSDFSAAWSKPIPANVLVFALRSDPAAMFRALTAEGEVLPFALVEATPLHAAAYEGDLAALDRDVGRREWLSARSYWGFTPLDLAIARGHEDAAVRLLAAGADPAAAVCPALHLAASFHRPKVIAALLAGGASVDARDADGATPLAHAARGGMPCMWELRRISAVGKPGGATFRPALELLLEHGADPNARGADEAAPLHVAVAETNAEAIEVLLEQGARADLADRRGNTPLQALVAQGRGEFDASYWERSAHHACLTLLLAHTAELNARNAAGQTALQLAMAANNMRTAQLLMASGADGTMRDDKGRTAKQRVEEILTSALWRGKR